VTWENWWLVVAKSVVAVFKSLSRSDTFASRAAFSRAAAWAASRQWSPLWPRQSWLSRPPPPLTLWPLGVSQSQPRQAQASTPASPTRWRPLRRRSQRRWLYLSQTGGQLEGTPERASRSPWHQPPPPEP
jgi:hypothetical protein